MFPGPSDPFLFHLAVFALALLAGAFAAGRVVRSQRAPLAAMAGALASVAVVGGLLAAGLPDGEPVRVFAFVALLAGSAGVAGTFLAIHRMSSVEDKHRG